MGSAVRARRRSRTAGCSIMAVLFMTLLLGEFGAARGRVLSPGTSKKEVAGVESARVGASSTGGRRASSRASPGGRVFTMATGPSRKGPGH
ncbi:hypothetical protein EUGRSUZ_I00782 [Eucalyptus grandis]|uniref:Uncharacterized protein n=3 Tax=Eucalyptus TaxID=3932 RepID=A0ACC3JFX7_EUCGR|nr:hypothetical protein EUGRSUZ_I00782 [Eucalyptus grandis]